MASLCIDSSASDDSTREIVDVLLRFIDNSSKSTDLTRSVPVLCLALEALNDVIFSATNASKFFLPDDLFSADLIDQSPISRIVRLLIRCGSACS